MALMWKRPAQANALTVMREGYVKVLPPHTVYVDYCSAHTRLPIWEISQIPFDADGVAFPADLFLHRNGCRSSI